jgi:hypothetical protein
LDGGPEVVEFGRALESVGIDDAHGDEDEVLEVSREKAEDAQERMDAHAVVAVHKQDRRGLGRLFLDRGGRLGKGEGGEDLVQVVQSPRGLLVVTVDPEAEIGRAHV